MCEQCGVAGRYRSVGTDTTLHIFLMSSPLIQFGPQPIGLPVVEAFFDCMVQRPLSVGLCELEVLTQLAEGTEGGPTGSGLDELLKQFLGLALWVCLISHGSPPRQGTLGRASPADDVTVPLQLGFGLLPLAS